MPPFPAPHPQEKILEKEKQRQNTHMGNTARGVDEWKKV